MSITDVTESGDERDMRPGIRTERSPQFASTAGNPEDTVKRML